LVVENLSREWLSSSTSRGDFSLMQAVGSKMGVLRRLDEVGGSYGTRDFENCQAAILLQIE
jgi:hypothetical protein